MPNTTPVHGWETPSGGDKAGAGDDALSSLATQVEDTLIATYVASIPVDRAQAGTDATSHIQGKIDGAATIAAISGRQVEVLIPASANGDPYLFTELEVKPNVTLRSTGGVLKLADNTCVSGGTSYYLIHNLDGMGGQHDGARFIDLIVDGNSANNSSFTVADAITAGGDNVVVWGCELNDIPDSGIMWSGVTNGLCGSNRINGCSDVGIYVNDGDGTNASENLLFGNRITDAAQGGIAVKRISQRTVILGNVIADCGNGITLENASTSSDYSLNLSIIGNQVRHVGYGAGSPAGIGIDLRRADHAVCVGNRIEDPRAYGIIMQGAEHATVQGNVISLTGSSDSTSRGIYMIDRDATGNRYCSITGNTIEGARNAGIRIEATGGGVSKWNTITGNTSVDCALGLSMRAGCESNTITDNVFGGSTADVEHIATAVGNIFSNNVLTTGVLSGNPDQATQTTHLLLRQQRMSNGTAAPTAGTWSTGDIVWSRTPNHGGGGWRCTSGGTPGTWVAFGHTQLSASTTWDPPSIAAGSSTATSVAVTGALVTDIVEATFSTISTNNIVISAHVQSTGSVRVVLSNPTGGAIDLASGTLVVNVRRMS